MVIFRILIVMVVVLTATDLSMAQSGKPSQVPARKFAMSGACGFGLSDTFGGRLSNGESDEAPFNQQQATYMAYIQKRGYKPEHLVINFSCESENDFPKICKEMVGVDFKDGKWTPAPLRDSVGNSKIDVLNPILLSLDGARIHGALYIKSDANGPIQFRLRTLGFCISNDSGTTLWGGAVLESAPYNIKKSTESEAIRLIKSIEFGSAPNK